MLYHVDRYPEDALGPVTFIWKPRSGSDCANESRQLWIWMHPAFKQVYDLQSGGGGGFSLLLKCDEIFCVLKRT